MILASRTPRETFGNDTVNNDDWDTYWFLNDERINLLHGSDETFLQFICEMIHPVVRPSKEESAEVASYINESLRVDGWEIVERTQLAGRPVYAARPLLTRAGPHLRAAREMVGVLDAAYMMRQITRMEVAIEDDPELAIGTAKEFIETICKTILNERAIEFNKKDDLPRLVRQTLRVLKLFRVA